jgi:hypothetical protein
MTLVRVSRCNTMPLRLSQLGQERPIHDVQFESAYPPVASESLHRGKCRDGPCMDGARGARGI